MASGISLKEIQKIFPKASVRKIISSLLDRGFINVTHNLQDLYKPKFEKYLFLPAHLKNDEKAMHEQMDNLERAPKQLKAFLAFLQLNQREGAVSRKKVMEASSVASSVISALVNKGTLEMQDLLVDRVHLDPYDKVEELILSPSQQQAYEKTNAYFDTKKAVLLKGITGSGKTHIYFKLIEDCIEQGKQVLYLLPEIALTAQIIRRLQQKFGKSIGIYHSRFGNQERVEIWQKTLQGNCKIIIGARSALMLPFQNLGLIIVDEEHDNSFKQHQPAPRYQARDAALFLARQEQANIILGTATPSLDSNFNVQKERFGLVEIKERFGDGALPKVKIIDIKKATEEKQMRGLFSFELIEAIKEALGNRKQVILFQNRRGYAPFLMCYSCGWIPQCEQCDVSLTYHKGSDKLHCHYCGMVYPYPDLCNDCNSNQVQTKSFGTQRIEEEVQKEFPNARVSRFDWDALKKKNAYKDILNQFENRQIDILVGTQMIAKGVDFDNVSLVGVLSADSLLSYPDFRVNERVFQLLEQVSGRAGRTDDQGKVLIQSQRPDHPILQFVKEHSYDKFYTDEIKSREDFVYPPYCRLIKITLRHPDMNLVGHAANELVQKMISIENIHIIGPALPPVARIRNNFLQEILIKLPKKPKLIEQIKESIYKQTQILTAERHFKNVRVVLDVDP